jgi:hypothetical protein
MISKYEIAAKVAVEGIERRWLKMTAAEQKDVFGAYVFGKQSLWIDAEGQGELIVHRSCCFGTDGMTARFSFDDVAAAANAGRKLRCD